MAVNKKNIRERDRRQYGPIPEGYTMHHLWYSEEYDPESFVVITVEEHKKLHAHGCGFSASGFDKKAYDREYSKNNRDKINEKRREYYKLYMREYRKRRKEEDD